MSSADTGGLLETMKQTGRTGNRDWKRENMLATRGGRSVRREGDWEDGQEQSSAAGSAMLGRAGAKQR